MRLYITAIKPIGPQSAGKWELFDDMRNYSGFWGNKLLHLM